MPEYRRKFRPGGMFFFTVVTQMRQRRFDYNPIKHRLVRCPHAWPYSSFHRWVREGYYREDWLCDCRGTPEIPANLFPMSDFKE
jgi:hypothetical protein